MARATNTDGTTVCVVTVTTPSEAVALELAEALVERSLVACAQIGGPIRSVYRWKDELERSEEWTLTLKTVHARTAVITALVEQLHPYDVPELLVADVGGGTRAYLDWVVESSTGSS